MLMKRSSFVLVFCVLWFAVTISSAEVYSGKDVLGRGPLVKKDKRTSLVTTEYGEISAVRVDDYVNGSYLLHFFTLEPNSLFLPALLHADMIFYVHTGSGKIGWTEEGGLQSTELSRGDLYALKQGSVFFIQSNLDTKKERQKLRIHAIFANLHNGLQVPIDPYSSIRNMIIGFDRKVLQAAFKVPEDVIDELLNSTEQPAIIHGVSKAKGTRAWEMEIEFVRGLLRSRSYDILELNKKKKKKSGAAAYNLFKEDKDFENRNGWSTAVTRKKLSALKGSHVGVFMVNLTAGSMMGPHWNPMASEIAVVLEGRGMVRTVCSSISNEMGCNNSRFEVEEGDMFVVSRFHPMAQMAFNNGTFVFMGFSTSTTKNHPQFLAGQASVFRTLDRDVLAMSFNVTNTTLDQLLGAEGDSVILSCVSCAEEEFSVMEEEIERERQEAQEREEEEARKREEERRREEEAARKREEEEARRQEEEEERKRREEERRQEEEEEEKRREEEEEKRKEEEEAARREEEEKRQEEQEQERKRREEEEEAARRQEEQERKRREEAAARREEEEARREEEEAARRQEEQERKRREEAAARREEEEARREEEEARRTEEEGRQRAQEEESRREEKEAREREQAAAAREQEARQRKKEKARQREEEQEEERRREEAARQQEEEQARRQEKERRVEREEEEAARRREEKARRREEEEGRGGKSEEERAAEEERKMEEDVRKEQATRQRRRKQEEEEEEYGGEKL